jgi:nucleotide-binding universal stress UspA family protein
MYTNILIPTDGSELAGKAVQHGIALAKRIGAKVTALTVLLPFHVFTTDTQMIEDTPAQYRVRMQEHAEKTLSAVGQAAQAAGVACETVDVEHEHPYRAIIDTAASKGCDLIVMASHGRHGISAMVLAHPATGATSLRENGPQLPEARALGCFSRAPCVRFSGHSFSGRAADHDRGDGRQKTDKTASPMPNGGMAEAGSNRLHWSTGERRRLSLNPKKRGCTRLLEQCGLPSERGLQWITA